MTEKIKTILAEPDSNVLYAQMQLPFVTDPSERFNVIGVYTAWSEVKKYVEELHPQLLVINSSISPDLRALMDLLAKLTAWKGVAIVTLIPSNAAAKDILTKITTCRGVFLQPIADWKQIADAGANAVTSELAKKAAQAPLQAAEGWRKENAIAGTRVVSFLSGMGGVGRSTIAENVAYRLSKSGIKTLLMSFDLPAPAVIRFGIKYEPDASYFFSRPNDGFEGSLQHKGDLDILVAPEKSADYDRAMGNPTESSIFALVQSTWMRNYAAVILDLPHGESGWTLQPYFASNTVMIVTRPTWTDLMATKHLLNLLDRLKGEDNRVPKSSISLVINQFRQDNVLSPTDYLDDIHKRCPSYQLPLASIIAYDPHIANCQDSSKIPADDVPAFDESVREICNSLFPGQISVQSKKKGLFGR
jgi:MinD-like ATPase involved in chromosome partitioning or flagellar assembly